MFHGDHFLNWGHPCNELVTWEENDECSKVEKPSQDTFVSDRLPSANNLSSATIASQGIGLFASSG